MSKQDNYQELQEELDSILADLQRDDIDVDAAMKQYERGLTIVQKLETHLKTAENTITELHAKFNKDA
jgi:exodeoxyribonuclease VII small subunit